MIVAIQGEAGSFSDEAAQAFFGAQAIVLPCREFRDLGAAVNNSRAEYGMLPIENSIAGSVLPAYDVLATTQLNVLAEITRPIRHCLMSAPGASFDTLRRVLSHPVALAQCSRFFETHPQLEALAVYDTAGAAKEVAQRKDPAIAALAARAAADRYGLEVIREDLQDRDDNQTRFYVVGRVSTPLTTSSGVWKTALLLETENRPGALLAVLTPLAQQDINLTKLESRPAETPWSYQFFLEFEGTVSDPHVEAALDHVARAAKKIRLLGSFAVMPNKTWS